MLQQDDLVKRAGAVREIAGGARMSRDIARDQPQMIAVAGEIDALALERGQHQCRFGDRQDPSLRARPDRAESAHNSRGRGVQGARSYSVAEVQPGGTYLFCSLPVHPQDRRSSAAEPPLTASGLDRGCRCGVGRFRTGLARSGGGGSAAGTGRTRPDIDIRDHPLHARYISRHRRGAVELCLAAGRADQIDRTVYRLDRVIDRANMAVEDQVRTSPAT